MSAAHRVVARKLLRLYDETDDYVEGTAARASCKRGCHHCCYQAVSIPLIEAIGMLDGLHRDPAWTPERITALRRQCADDAAFGRSLPLETFYDDYMLSLRGCPLLDKQSGDCTAYAQRPLQCRIYFSEGDPADCSVANVGNVVRILSPPEEVVTQIVQLVTLRSREAGIPFARGTIAEMLLAAFEIHERSPRDFERWIVDHCEVVVIERTGEWSGKLRRNPFESDELKEKLG